MYYDLVIAAEKYELDESLKNICEQRLCNSLTSVSNAIASLIFAEDHKLDKLKEEAIKFIVDDLEAVADILDFESIAKRPKIMRELFRAIGKENKNLSSRF